MPDIKPSRENWSEFCEEPALTNEEWREHRDLAFAILGDDEMQTRLLDATLEEHIDRDTVAAIMSTDDWSDIVAQADASRRLMRAELEWMREHVE